MGQYTDPAQANLLVGGAPFSNTQNYRRHELRGTIEQILRPRRTSHAAKAGAGYEFSEEENNRLANGWGTIATINQNGIPALRARYFTAQPAQRGQGRTYSVFVQDDISLGTRLFVNAGLLLNRDEFSQVVTGSGGCPVTVRLKGGAAPFESHGDRCAFLRFGFGDEVQPRSGSVTSSGPEERQGVCELGAVLLDGSETSARSLAPNASSRRRRFQFVGQRTFEWTLANTTGKLIDPTLAPTYNDEFVVGYATPLGRRYGLDVFFLSRTTITSSKTCRRG
jgi:hypothetical protein